MNMSSYFIAISFSAASSPIASKSPGMPIASGKPDCRMSVESSSFDAASTSQVRLKDAYLGGLMEEQRGDPSHQEEGNSEDSDNLAAGTWYYKGEPGAQNNKSLEEPPCTRSQFFRWPGKSKEYGSDMGPLFPYTAGHIASVHLGKDETPSRPTCAEVRSCWWRRTHFCVGCVLRDGWTEESLHRRSVGLLSRRRCRRSQEKLI